MGNTLSAIAVFSFASWHTSKKSDKQYSDNHKDRFILYHLNIIKMKKFILSPILLAFVLFLSCESNNENEKFGQMSFASNYHIINCITKVSVYIDDVYIADITEPSDSILTCGINGNVTKQVIVGTHTYKVLIGNDENEACYKEVTGSVEISSNECKTFFINVREIFDNHGKITVGANYHVVNCPIKATVYIDDLLAGELTKPCDSINDCGMEGNITQQVETGLHTYKCVFYSSEADSCYNETSGSIYVDKDECKKIFIDLFDL